LIELLVVIAIIAVLIGLLLPAMQKVREAANRMSCQNNLKQLGLAFHTYENIQRSLPPRRLYPNPYQGWGPQLLPYLEQTAIAQRYRLDLNFFDPKNRDVIRIPLRVFSCPSALQNRMIDILDLSNNPTGSTGAAGDYFAPNSVDAYWWPEPARTLAADEVECPALADNRGRMLSEIRDGLSTTLLVSELAGRPEHWIKGALQPTNAAMRLPYWWGPWAPYNSCIYKTWTDDGRTPGGFCTINCNNSWGIYSFHTGGANALLGDGSVHFLRVGLNREVFAALVTRAGGEAIDASDY
jgi:prepilin-type processing-associated H-X9-DG protein